MALPSPAPAKDQAEDCNNPAYCARAGGKGERREMPE